MDQYGPGPMSQQNKSGILWILWLSMVGSIFIYAIVGFMVRENTPAPEDTSMVGVLTLAFSLVSIGTSALALLFGRLTGGKMDYQPFCIIRWALAESIAIYGLVLFILGASWAVFIPFLVWAIIMQLLLAPTHNSQQRYMDRKRSSPGMPDRPAPL